VKARNKNETIFSATANNSNQRKLPCDENRAKIDDLIVTLESINRALYRDKISQFDNFSRFFC
jgi:hypothetical protein